MAKKPVVLVLMVFMLSISARAQEIPFDSSTPSPDTTTSDNATVTEQKQMEDLNQPPPAPRPTPPPAAGQVKKPRAAPAELSGLGTLAPFNDIAVISKRFLPKTNRFEIFPNLGTVLNDAFFNDYIFGVRIAYHLKEAYGIELTALTLSTTAKAVTEELKVDRFVDTTALATPKNYFGAAFKWTPIYGKMGFMNKRIVPFDFYFLVGGGITQTNQDTSPMTLHLGLGQLFAISKWIGFRWDISWFGYQSSTKVTQTGNSGGGSFSNLHATIGASFFIPEAEYR